MGSTHKITLEIPDKIYAGIIAFSKKNHISDSGTAATELIKYALSLPPYFKYFDWDRAEEEADADYDHSCPDSNSFISMLKHSGHLS